MTTAQIYLTVWGTLAIMTALTLGLIAYLVDKTRLPSEPWWSFFMIPFTLIWVVYGNFVIRNRRARRQPWEVVMA